MVGWILLCGSSTDIVLLFTFHLLSPRISLPFIKHQRGSGIPQRLIPQTMHHLVTPILIHTKSYLLFFFSWERHSTSENGSSLSSSNYRFLFSNTLRCLFFLFFFAFFLISQPQLPLFFFFPCLGFKNAFQSRLTPHLYCQASRLSKPFPVASWCSRSLRWYLLIRQPILPYRVLKFVPVTQVVDS